MLMLGTEDHTLRNTAIVNGAKVFHVTVLTSLAPSLIAVACPQDASSPLLPHGKEPMVRKCPAGLPAMGWVEARILGGKV